LITAFVFHDNLMVLSLAPSRLKPVPPGTVRSQWDRLEPGMRQAFHRKSQAIDEDSPHATSRR
jgi:hypothetical protein